LELNDKYSPLAISSDRYFILTGGRGSGKSFSVSLILTLLTYETGHVILFTRYTMRSARISIIPEFVEKIELMGRSNDFHITKDEITNKLSGSRIIFSGIKTSSGDQTANLKSIQGVTTWVLDEAEEMRDEKIFDKIDLSVRSQLRQNRIVLLLNPSTKEHFIYKKFFEVNGVQTSSNESKDNCTYIHTTYLDNKENLSESFLRSVGDIKKRSPKKFTHEIMGGWLERSEGVIFDNWEIKPYQSFGTSIFGQDFGFSIDPTTLIEASIDHKKKEIYTRLHFHEAGLSTSQIYDLDKQYAGNSLIVADSAEPRLISELRSKGLNIVEAIKGQGSVNYGISVLLDFRIFVDPNSVEMIKEFNNYCWLERKSNTPIDAFNHCIDPLRYRLSYEMNRPNRGKYFIG